MTDTVWLVMNDCEKSLLSWFSRQVNCAWRMINLARRVTVLIEKYYSNKFKDSWYNIKSYFMTQNIKNIFELDMYCQILNGLEIYKKVIPECHWNRFLYVLMQAILLDYRLLWGIGILCCFFIEKYCTINKGKL